MELVNQMRMPLKSQILSTVVCRIPKKNWEMGHGCPLLTSQILEKVIQLYKKIWFLFCFVRMLFKIKKFVLHNPAILWTYEP